VNAEMPGDGMDVEEPEDQQRNGNQAHEGQRHDEERRETVQAASPLPMAAPPGLLEHRKRLGRHPSADLRRSPVGGPTKSVSSRRDLDHDAPAPRRAPVPRSPSR
jgi:hypothetical protein